MCGLVEVGEKEFRDWEHRGGSWDVDLLNLSKVLSSKV